MRALTYEEMLLEQETRSAALRARALQAPYSELFRIAVQSPDTGGGGTCLRLLLSLHNGTRFRFDLTDLRRLDAGLHAAAIAVLSDEVGFAEYISARIAAEVGMYAGDVAETLERLAQKWGDA